MNTRCFVRHACEFLSINLLFHIFFFFCKHLDSQCRVFVPITVLIIILCNIIFDAFLAINVFSVGKFICARSDNDIKLE